MSEGQSADLSRRRLFTAGGALATAGAFEVFLPKVAFAAPESDATADPNGDSGSTQTRTITGTIPADAADWYYLPIEIPAGANTIAVDYSYDKPTPPAGFNGNACDIGMFGPEGYQLGNGRGFRGWSGGARTSFEISASEATPGYLAGPVSPGTWHVILGPYTVVPAGLHYTVNVTLTFGPAGTAFVPNPAPTTAPARARGRSWYRGDGHLHTVYSDGRRTQAELVADARTAGLDFVVSTEHNTPSGSLNWGTVATDDLLIVNGEEVTTRTGHWPASNLPVGHWIDWRYRADDPADFARFVDEVHAVGGLVTAAHPFGTCLGCSWEFNYEQADLIEVWNGPWTLDDESTVTAWDSMLRTGRWIPAVGDSDAHNPDQVVGLPHNVVLADDLRAGALMDGLRAGHNWLAESSAVDLTMNATDGVRTAGIGERLRTGAGTPVTVTVILGGVPGTQVRFIDQIGPQYTATVPASGAATVTWTALPRYTEWVRVEVRRAVPTATTVDTMVALTNPVFLDRR
ncbi:MAG TPA: CehA/McbA family metallohydrolase [Pseudonocardiaceae bacterium]|nr:CehA/McbA family metallohydrolase [Pseudonocardiaceae bacterium]